MRKFTGRPKKFDTSILMEIITGYINNTKYITKLKYIDLSDYGKKIGYENIEYFDFSRNLEIKKFVNEFNEKLKKTNYNLLKDISKFNPLKMDVDYIVNTCAGNKKYQRALLNMFKDNHTTIYNEVNIAQEEIKRLTNINHNLIKENEHLKLKLKRSTKEKNILKEKIQVQKNSSKLQDMFEAIEFCLNAGKLTSLSRDELELMFKGFFVNQNNDLLSNDIDNLVNDTLEDEISNETINNSGKNSLLHIKDIKKNDEDYTSFMKPNIFD